MLRQACPIQLGQAFFSPDVQGAEPQPHGQHHGRVRRLRLQTTLLFRTSASDITPEAAGGIGTAPRTSFCVPHVMLTEDAMRRNFFSFIHGRDRLMVGQTEEKKCRTSRIDPVTPN